MDFPLFHLDVFGDRLLFATIAITHVLINHALAVGAMPLVTLIEWWGVRSGDPRWDRLAYRLLTVFFIVTTTAGALTGVGIWFVASLVNPTAIGSLIHVFFWAWFTEWLVFVGEVVLILTYYLSWHGWGTRHKRAHVGVGVALSAFSWGTMAVIVAILGFQMSTGVWTVRPGFWNAIFNPLYRPQLAFRGPFALVAAALAALMLVFWFVRDDREFRARAVRLISLWTLAWIPGWLLGALAYRRAVPAEAARNIDIALTSLRWQQWTSRMPWLIAGATAAIIVVVAWGAWKPARLPRAALLVPAVLTVWLLGYFERVREFIRKPDVIASYLYANGLRRADYPLLREDGLLRTATYTATRTATGETQLIAGREMFRLACSRCHTTTGMNGVVAKLTNLYGPGPWDQATIDAYLAGMQNTRPFMPPLPGTSAERAALAAWLIALRADPVHLDGAQTAGVAITP
ncbi:MAG: c-type cytochrome [Candidatus Krumholzibacteriia bacterium]